MTKKEAAIVTAYTGFMLGDWHEFHKYAEKLFKRPIFTDEFAKPKMIEKMRIKSKKDFCSIKI